MKRRANQGMAVVSALGFLVITVIFVGAAMMMGVSNRRLSTDNYQTIKAQYAAEAGVDRAVYEVFGNVMGPVYEANSTNPNFKANINTYVKALNRATVNGQTFTDGSTLTFSTTTLPDGSTYNVTVSRTDQTVPVRKVIFNVTSTGSSGQSKRRISQTLTVEGGKFAGDAYAVLSNNVNCIFCHTTVTSMEGAYAANGTTTVNISTNTANVNNTNRVKVAALESLIVDRAVDSVMSGTIYTRGNTNLIARGGMHAFNFQNQGNSNTVANAYAQLSTADNRNCGSGVCSPYGKFYTNYPIQNGPDGEIPERFPLPVPDEGTGPGEAGNRKIDDSEWKAAIEDDLDVGSIVAGNVQFMQTTSYGVLPSNPQLVSTVTSTADRGIAGNLILSGNIELNKNVYVDGDVVISGNIRGQGKLIARGNIYVVGDIKYNCAANNSSFQQCNYKNKDNPGFPQFSMLAGGNIMLGTYMVTATGHQNWTSTYQGTAYEGGTSGNKLTYRDEYFNQALTNVTSESPEFIDPGRYMPYVAPNVSRTDIINLPANQAIEDALIASFGTVPNADTPERRSYARATFVNGDSKGGSGTNRTRASFTANEMAAFNQREYCKAQSNSSRRNGCSFTMDGVTVNIPYEPGYKPRFYRLRDGAPVYRCPSPANDPSNCRSYGDPTYGNNTSNTTFGAGANATVISQADIDALGAVIYSASPTANWLARAYDNTSTDPRDSERRIKNMWVQNVENVDRDGASNNLDPALQVDGTLYSGNAIFTIGPVRSKIQGSITVNGSVIGADLGVLAAGNGGTIVGANNKRGLRVHYDDRLAGGLNIKTAKDSLIISRSNFEQKSY
jgi:hypothetical protein